MYRLRIEKKAKKGLKIIRDLYGEAVLDEAFSEIREFPYIGKPLSRELAGSFSYRIHVYRIIYKVDEDENIVRILIAGHRAHVYD